MSTPNITVVGKNKMNTSSKVISELRESQESAPLRIEAPNFVAKHTTVAPRHIFALIRGILAPLPVSHDATSSGRTNLE